MRAALLGLLLFSGATQADALLIVDGNGCELLRCQQPAIYVAQARAIECLPPLLANGFEGAPSCAVN